MDLEESFFHNDEIEDLTSRKEKIKKELENPLREEPQQLPPDFPGGYKTANLKVITLNHKYLVHNADNERVRNQIDKEYNIKHGDDEDYDRKFYSKKEDPSTQNILHKLCLGWAKTSGAQNVFNEIKNSDTQTKTLLINTEGVVIDGNRRLASFRELLTTSNEHRFLENIECKVLEHVSREINKSFEYDLHVKVDTTLNYGYYEKLRIVERLVKQGKEDSNICTILNIKDAELKNIKEENNEVKRQLEFRKKWCFDAGPGKEDAEFADNDIPRLIQNKIEYDIRATSTVQRKNGLSAQEKKLRTTLMRALTWANSEGENFGGSTFKTISKDDNLSIAIKDVTKEEDPKKALEVLENILKETKKEKDMTPINEFSKKIIEVSKEVDKKKKRTSKKSDSKTKSIKANQELNSIKISRETYNKQHQSIIKAQLENSQKNIKRILKEIDDFHKT